MIKQTDLRKIALSEFDEEKIDPLRELVYRDVMVLKAGLRNANDLIDFSLQVIDDAGFVDVVNRKMIRDLRASLDAFEKTLSMK